MSKASRIVFFCASNDAMNMAISLPRKGHVRLRSPASLIMVRPIPGFSWSTRLASSDWDAVMLDMSLAVASDAKRVDEFPIAMRSTLAITLRNAFASSESLWISS